MNYAPDHPLFDLSEYIELAGSSRVVELTHMKEDPGLRQNGEVKDQNNPRYMRWLHGVR